jgi:hypothetical protein
MGPDRFHIERGIKRHKTLLIQFNAGLEEISRRARNYYSDIHELFTFDSRNYSEYGVIIWIVIAHGSPPPGKHAAP